MSLADLITPWDGNPISRPGIYSGVEISRYHSQSLCDGPSVSRSGLWTIFDKSPAHFFDRSDLNPDRADEEPNEALDLGKAAHHLILGEANFREFYAIRPEEWSDWRKQDARDWRDDQIAAGKTVLTPEHVERIVGMAKGLLMHPMVRNGALSGLIEHTMVAKDPQTGIWLKVRPDVIPTDSGDYSDFKTALEVSDEALDTALGRDGLFVQGALVRKVVGLLGLPFNSFSLVFAEKQRPFCAQVKSIKPADMDLGEGIIRASLVALGRAMQRQTWPGPGGHQEDAGWLELKPWHRKKFEERLALMESAQ